MPSACTDAGLRSGGEKTVPAKNVISMQMKGLELRNQEVQLDTSTTGCNGKMKSHITIVKWDIKMMMKRQEEEEQEEE